LTTVALLTEVGLIIVVLFGIGSLMIAKASVSYLIGVETVLFISLYILGGSLLILVGVQKKAADVSEMQLASSID